MFERWFGLKSQNTTIPTELLAGTATFLTMAYILALQPAILSGVVTGRPTGMDEHAIFLATAISAALTTAMMGLYARLPVALASGMGQNLFFVSVVYALEERGIQDAWQVALGLVFVSGVLFLILSVLPVRRAIVSAMSPSLRYATTVGIGFFILLLGLRNATLLNPQAPELGLQAEQILSSDVAIFGAGFLVTATLFARRTPGSILWGIVVAAFFATALGKITWPSGSWLQLPDIQTPAVLQLDVLGALAPICIPYILVFLFMDLFDTTGTLVGLAQRAELMEGDEIRNVKQAFISDSAGTVLAACLGTSTVTSYIESAAGIEQGGRTGLTALAVAGWFLLALFFSPMILALGTSLPVTAAALVVVGISMVQTVRYIDWKDVTEYLPACLILFGIPAMFSIADGLALGLITYPVLKLTTGKVHQISWLAALLALVLIGYFVLVRSELLLQYLTE